MNDRKIPIMLQYYDALTHNGRIDIADRRTGDYHEGKITYMIENTTGVKLRLDSGYSIRIYGEKPDEKLSHIIETYLKLEKSYPRADREAKKILKNASEEIMKTLEECKKALIGYRPELEERLNNA